MKTKTEQPKGCKQDLEKGCGRNIFLVDVGVFVKCGEISYKLKRLCPACHLKNELKLQGYQLAKKEIKDKIEKGISDIFDEEIIHPSENGIKTIWFKIKELLEGL